MWNLVLDVGAYVLAVIAGLLVAFVALVLIAAVALRLPGVRAAGRALTRRRWGERDFYQPRLVRPWRWSFRKLQAFVDSLIGYELVVEEFQAGGVRASDGSSPENGAAAAATGPAADVAALTAAVRAALGASGVPTAPGGVDFVKARRTEGSALSAVADAVREVPEAKWLEPLVRLITTVLPRRTLVVHGHLLPAGLRGRGLALALAEQGGGVSVTERLWERTYDPRPEGMATRDTAEAQAEALHRLGVAAAGWAVYKFLEVQGAREEREQLGTGNWHSYAYFRAGLECQESHRPGQAQALYTRALERDPDNLAALHNLAVLNTREPPGAGEIPRKEDFERAIHRLRRLKAVLDRDPAQLLRRDPLWFQATYQLAATRLHEALIAADDAVPDAATLAQAWAEALALAIDLEGALLALKTRGRPARRGDFPRERARDLANVLRRIENSALVLVASLALLRADTPCPSIKTGGNTDENGAVDRARLLQALETVRAATGDGAPGPMPAGAVPELCELIINRYLDEEKRVELGYRARYNLACYHVHCAAYAQRAGAGDLCEAQTERALAELRFGVEAGNLITWAKRDPSLAWLRQRRAKRFEAIMQCYSPSEPRHGIRPLLSRLRPAGVSGPRRT